MPKDCVFWLTSTIPVEVFDSCKRNDFETLTFPLDFKGRIPAPTGKHLALSIPQDKHQSQGDQQMEKVFYEFRPHIYLMLASYALLISHSSWLMTLSGAILAVCGLIVIKFRLNYRTRNFGAEKIDGFSYAVGKAMQWVGSRTIKRA